MVAGARWQSRNGSVNGAKNVYNANMKKKVNQPLETTELQTAEPRTKVLASGGVYNYETGRIMSNPGGGKYAITRDNARDMVRRRVELKRAAVQAAAQDAVQNQAMLTKYGDEAWIAEVTQAQMILATTPDAGKASTIAAEWLVTNAGMGEKVLQQAQEGAAATVSLSAAGLGALVELLSGGKQVIDADVIPMRNELGAEVE